MKTRLFLSGAGALVLSVLFVGEGLCAQQGAVSKWVVYYADKVPAEAFLGFDLVVFDSDYHPHLPPLVSRGKTVLGYVSLGEAEDHRTYFGEVKAAGLLVRENSTWEGGHFVDLRNPRWSVLLLEKVIPAILRTGFNGLFLDTIDNAIELETSDPRKFAGMKAAAVDLVRRIRLRFPGIRIMLNRGFEILPEVDGHIDMVLGESVYSTYDFAARKYRPTTREDYDWQVARLKEAQKRRPGLQVFTLDYWDPDDVAGIRRIYRVERANGFVPYVATIKLDRVVEGAAQ